MSDPLHETADSFIERTIHLEEMSFYTISKGELPIHATFSAEKHAEAIRWLRDRGLQVTDSPPLFLTMGQFRQILRSQAPLADLELTPFFRKATPFQLRVWRRIARIPAGQTMTYGEIAREIGNHNSARAVGMACHANPVGLYIPCHRVVGKSGLGGYAGGLAIKKKILAIEQNDQD